MARFCPLAIARARVEVTVTLEFFSLDDVPTAALYQAARATIAGGRDVPDGSGGRGKCSACTCKV